MMIRYALILLAISASLYGSDTDQKTLEVQVNVPFWGVDKTMDIHVMEMTTLKRESLTNINAGMPVSFTLPPGEYLLKSSGQGFATHFIGPILIYPYTEKKRVTLDLEKGGSLSGLIYDESGSPLSNVRVSAAETRHFSRRDMFNPFLPDNLRTANIRSQKSMVTRTRPDGKFSFTGLSTKVSYIAMEKPGYSLSTDRLRVNPGCVLKKEYCMKPGEPAITLTLKDSEGKTVGDGWVYWLDPRRTLMSAGAKQPINYPNCAGPSNQDGRIEIIDPPPVPVDFWTAANGYKWNETQASPGRSITVTLQKAEASMEIIPVDMQEKAPIENSFLKLHGITRFDPPVNVIRTKKGSFLLQGDIESFPVFVTLGSDEYVVANSKYIWQGKTPVSGFDALPLYDGSLYGEERGSFNDLDVETLEDGKLFLAMEKITDPFRFNLHIIGEPGVPLDGIDLYCKYKDIHGNFYLPAEGGEVTIE
ncbi:MAG: carboxypeptidase-like regulatory domain-containing protein, partial [Planctomycetota bacterium]